MEDPPPPPPSAWHENVMDGWGAPPFSLTKRTCFTNEGHPRDVMDNRGWRATHEAAYGSHVDCLHHLLKQGWSKQQKNVFAMKNVRVVGFRVAVRNRTASMFAASSQNGTHLKSGNEMVVAGRTPHH